MEPIIINTMHVVEVMPEHGGTVNVQIDCHMDEGCVHSADFALSVLIDRRLVYGIEPCASCQKDRGNITVDELTVSTCTCLTCDCCHTVIERILSEHITAHGQFAHGSNETHEVSLSSRLI